jgi:hypothetical protein
MFLGAAIGSVVSCVVVTIGWTKWLHSRVNGPADRPFVVGHVVSTVSCFSFMSSYLFTILLVTVSDRVNWEWGGFFSCLLGGVGTVCLLGAFILPFGHTRIRWLSLLACALNAVPLFTFDFFYLGTSNTHRYASQRECELHSAISCDLPSERMTQLLAVPAAT